MKREREEYKIEKKYSKYLLRIVKRLVIKLFFFSRKTFILK